MRDPLTRTTVPVPCPECISFAICYNAERIRCKILYRFICYTQGGSGYAGIRPNALEEVYRVYGRYVYKTMFDKSQILLTNDPKKVNTYSLDGSLMDGFPYNGYNFRGRQK